MFDQAKGERTLDLKRDAVRREIEAKIDGGTFALTDVLNEREPYRSMALDYLHGRESRPGGEVTVTVKVTHEIVKAHAQTSLDSDTGRPSVVEQVVRTAPGTYQVGTRRAMWLLWQYGAGTKRVQRRPERSRQAWCEEVPPGASASPPNTREAGRRAAGAAA